MTAFDSCINFFKYVFLGLFDFLNSIFPFGFSSVSLLEFFIGAFLVFLIVDNFVLKGK